MQRKRFLDNAYVKRSAAEVIEYYDRWSEVYDEELTENNYRQPRRCAEALARHLTNMDAPILDAGCGTGLSGLALREAGFTNIEGCDFSPGMLEKAHSFGIYDKLFTADLNKPPLDSPDGAYAALTAVGVFSYGHVMPDALDEFLRVLRPGSPIVIGLNAHFFAEGLLTAKIEAMVSAGLVDKLSQEHGEHIPDIGLSGWVIALRRV